jgi:hypothetical protein
VAASAARRSEAGRAPDRLRPVPNDRLEIRHDPAKGRGVFATAPIAAGSLIEAAPVIIVAAEQCKLLDRTILHDYYFHWDGDPDGEGSGAVALGLVAPAARAGQAQFRASDARPRRARTDRGGRRGDDRL